MTTLFELKQSVHMIGEQLQKKTSEQVQLISNPASSDEDINRVEGEINSLNKRFDIAKAQLEREEQAVREEHDLNEANGGGYSDLSESARQVKAKAEFYRHVLLPQEFPKPTEEANRILLHALPAGNSTGGDKLLPTTVSKEIISEPFAKNPLRESARMTNIKGLELPRLSYTLDDDDFILDTETAKEMQLKGDTVKFGTNKFKVFAAASDTVIHGSDLDLVNWIENALRSGLAAKEKKDAFTETPKSGLEHMSFYTAGEVKQVGGADVYDAVVNALADLHEDYRDNATIYMRYSDYVSVVKTLSNGTTNFFDTPAEKIWGYPVKFTDAAKYPVIGDFNYFGINYENTTFDTDKDVKKGEYLFVLTAWYDQQRSLNSAFRIAKVGATVPVG
ncbi:phage major capsid protein [Macrococcus bovicus]|uniref:phage major capsid protein n=1 Tax=Macrococcus bovicus TaxID=69968 RepID=UPI0025A67F5A|nr:phage major capsid protein [Macrococcus bovicus]WJP97070.1 phage major capsid protein [Macrococcus bovicus]